MENHIMKPSGGRTVMYSFEFFPPKDEAGEDRLWAAIESLRSIAPDFISVTYGAGGSNRDRTVRITSEISAHTNVPTVAHLTCVGSTESELREILAQYQAADIKNILALRGDPTGGPRAPWETTPGGFEHADQLVSLARELGFTVGVAAFPDGHPGSLGNHEQDVEVLLEKERRGASFATTQFFFDSSAYKKLVDSLAARGSQMPIIPGILPVTNVKQLNRMAELNGTPIPAAFAERLDAVKKSPEDVYKVGVEMAIELSREVLDAGAPGIHFFTMNTSPATRDVYEAIKNYK
jgi:methylenetetrahydrofolate reductase (NADPH)